MSTLLRASLYSIGALGMALPQVSTANPLVIKFSHVVADDSPKGQAALRFKALAEQRTGGRVRVDVYSNSRLYKDKEELEALQLGAVQMLAPSLAKFSPLGVREFEVFDLPYLFDTPAALHKVTEGPVGKELLKKLEPKGIVGLAFWDNGFKVISANKPIRLPGDLKGLKMRIQSSRVISAQMQALGAIPQVMAFSEAYQALQTGIVDGTENPPSNLYTQRMHDVQRFVTVTNHGYLGYAVITNKKFWDGLPSDLRGQLEAAMRDATLFANTIAEQNNQQALQAIKDSGKCKVLQLTPAELQQWKNALLPIYPRMQEQIGAGFIERVQTAVGYPAASQR